MITKALCNSTARRRRGRNGRAGDKDGYRTGTPCRDCASTCATLTRTHVRRALCSLGAADHGLRRALKYRRSRSETMEVEREAMGDSPSPWTGSRSALVRARHAACGASTRFAFRRRSGARAVRRVVCAVPRAVRVRWRRRRRRGRAGSRAQAARLALPEHPARRGRGDRRADPDSGLGERQPIVLTGDRRPAPCGRRTPANAAKDGRSRKGGELVKGSSYTLALPHGWTQTEPQNGQTFAASADGGAATAALWVERDPKLTFPQFESQSLAQLRRTAGSAQVTRRTPAPTADGTIVTLAPDPNPGAPAYQVTLRVTGPYRYYLATTVEANASRDAAGGAELIHSSFVPVATGKSG